MEGDIKGKTGKLDELRREAARYFFCSGDKISDPPLYFVTAQNGRSIKGGVTVFIIYTNYFAKVPVN